MATRNNDSYMATGITMLLFGILFLVNTIYPFSRMGYGFVMDIDNLICYAAVIFLIFKKEKNVGIILALIWLMLNFGVIIKLLGAVSSYIIPVALIILGGIVIYKAKK